MVYKNCSCTAKTFHGVTFEPGQTKEVDGIINNLMMIRVDDSATKATKSTQQKPSSEQPKEAVPIPDKNPVNNTESNESKETEVKADDKNGKGKKS